MPIDERVVATPGFVDLVGAASQVGTSQCVLESSSVANCVALIAQFSQLSAHAHDMFTALMDESCATLERISNLSARVTSLSTTCSASDDAQLAAAKYAKNNEGEVGRTGLTFVAMRDTLPPALRTRVEACAAPPNVSLLDDLDEQHNCAAKYSHPDFFIEQWLISERQRQAGLEQQRARRREERRARRKLERAGRKDGQMGRIAVSAVKKKKYNVHGQEFAGAEEAVEAPRSLPTTTISRRSSLAPASEAAPPPPPPPPPQQQQPPADARSELLAGIQKGMALKPVAKATQAPASSPREDLMSQIRMGSAAVLRSTPQRKTPPPPPTTPKADDAYSEIKALLDRRQFLAPVDESSDASSGSDSDDWDD
ncbi:unnamed protein product (mitochondrion) [Plasmodiophora brassicae]|uniref:WH2 domain-containing protein n=1 Tax=Plasmodiophora brassicae TaxID=37360 RepID=A0A3P3YF79_PLABS|nr:unnamed protein product [Plasmodiophora brassicae]